jgi:acyl-CoA synthetase (AMP-forming)/AMP-acid ligase II
MTHGAGVLALMLMPRAPTNVILDKTDPQSILSAIEAHGVTHLYLPPTVLYALLASPELPATNLASLKFFLISAAPVAPEKLRAAVHAFGPVMAQAFGQAEAPFFLTFLSPEDHRRAAQDQGSERLLQGCGRPTMFSRVEIMNEDGDLLPPRAMGEIVARSNLVMQEYYKDPEATRAVSAFGWHHTGDIGFKDERRIRLYRRSQTRHDHFGRVQRVLDRSRSPPPRTRSRSGLRGHRRAQRKMG